MDNSRNFSEMLREIERLKNNNSLVIVEGKKDRVALQNIGISNIFVINENGKSIYEKIEQISQCKDKEVILLTDIDKEGKKIYMLMKKHLSQMNVKMNNKIRELMIKLKISHIEGLDSFIKNYQKISLYKNQRK